MIIKKKPSNLNRDTIHKYLDIKNNQPSQKIQACITQAIEEVIEQSEPKYEYKVYTTFKIESNMVDLNHGELVMKSQDLSEHLKTSEKIVVLAVTAGTAIDRLIKKNSIIDASKGLISDAVASTYVEALADMSSKAIVKEYNSFRNFRYSPGYGDLSLSVQSEVLKVLEANKTLGLYTNNSHLLIPSKSITGIFGLFTKPTNQNKSCSNCHLLKDCNYRKRGVRCYA